jgi:deoxyinosine 3'endonuclease (endonuclease V)
VGLFEEVEVMIFVDCVWERKTIATMDVEAESGEEITAAMVNSYWREVSPEYAYRGVAASGDRIECPYCGGPLSFHSEGTVLTSGEG